VGARPVRHRGTLRPGGDRRRGRYRPVCVEPCLGRCRAAFDNRGAAAILVAASSNNILKAAYTAGFAGGRAAIAPASALVLLALASGAVAWWFAGLPGRLG
jgi:hypothetical protein